jgi:glycosyltransferase involved in cell wall biosynthesis
MKPGTVTDKRDAGRLRVLFAGHLPPPLGGIATYCQSVLASSLAQRLELSFVQTSTHDRDLSQAGSASFRNLSAAFQDVVRFFKAVRAQRPQVCHLNTAYGSSFVKNSLCLAIARLQGSQALLHLHCSLPALYTSRPGWWRWFFRRVLRLTNGVIALSSEWLELAQIVPGRPVFLLENAIDLAPYQAIARERYERQAPDGRLHVLYLGYIWRAKGSFDLVEAARQVSLENKQVVFELVGSEMRPPELQQLAALIQESGLEGVVSLQPPVFGEEKLACFRRACLFVYPSYSEGMPMAVIEAMASGLPVVASRAGGLPDLVQDGVTGLLVEPGKPEQLAAALGRLIHDPALRRSMGEQGARLAAQRFDIEQHAARLVEIYDRVLSSGGKSA